MMHIRAMPIMVGSLCILAIAFRYYSAFLAAKVAAFDDTRITPAHRFNDGQNYQPTNRWVLFGHHFAAISGAGPLIGPVLAMQYGYAPGLLWILIGVCLGGAVQDMLVMFASVRRGGKSLAEIARTELGNTASLIASAAILFIVIIALAGLAFVVVKSTRRRGSQAARRDDRRTTGQRACDVLCHDRRKPRRGLAIPCGLFDSLFAKTNVQQAARSVLASPSWNRGSRSRRMERSSFPAVASRSFPAAVGEPSRSSARSRSPCSSACGCIASAKGALSRHRIIGGTMVLAAVFAGAYVPGSSLESIFGLSRTNTIIALCVYGFIAAVLPVWMLLTPRDYLVELHEGRHLGAAWSSASFVANPTLKHPPLNETWRAAARPFPAACSRLCSSA